jgi:hypothetical protein
MARWCKCVGHPADVVEMRPCARGDTAGVGGSATSAIAALRGLWGLEGSVVTMGFTMRSTHCSRNFGQNYFRSFFK